MEAFRRRPVELSYYRQKQLSTALVLMDIRNMF